MIEATVLAGNEEKVKERLEGLFDLGATEVLVSVVHAGSDRAASVERTMNLLAEVSGSLLGKALTPSPSPRGRGGAERMCEKFPFVVSLSNHTHPVLRQAQDERQGF